MHSRKSSLATEALCVKWQEGAEASCLPDTKCRRGYLYLLSLYYMRIVFALLRFMIPCWPAAGPVILITYFKIFVGVLRPHMRCLKVTVWHDSKRHAHAVVIWRKRELFVSKWNSYCLRLSRRWEFSWGECSRALPKSKMKDDYQLLVE